MAIRAPFRRSSERLRANLLPPEVQHRPASLAGRSCRASTASPRRDRATTLERVTWARSGGWEEIGGESVGERVEGGRAGLERREFTSTGGVRVHAGGAVGGGVGSGERPLPGGGNRAHPGRPAAALGRGGSPLLRVPAEKSKVCGLLPYVRVKISDSIAPLGRYPKLTSEVRPASGLRA